jgi:hypothetical protein
MFLTVASTALLIVERLALLVVFGTVLYFAAGFGYGYLIDRGRRASGRTSRHSASRAR